MKVNHKYSVDIKIKSMVIPRGAHRSEPMGKSCNAAVADWVFKMPIHE